MGGAKAKTLAKDKRLHIEHPGSDWGSVFSATVEGKVVVVAIHHSVVVETVDDRFCSAAPPRSHSKISLKSADSYDDEMGFQTALAIREYASFDIS